MQNFTFKVQLEEYRLAQQKLKEENYRLQQSFQEKITFENNLLLKMDLLLEQVDELNEFHFQMKLKKLLKNLIEYLFEKFYPKHMFFNIIKNKMEFYNFPLSTELLMLIGKDKVIGTLNALLDKIFSRIKINDYIVHFVDSNATENKYLRRFIKVFKARYGFFEYFHIKAIDRKILLEIIPEDYFMVIDNFKFDKCIKELIQNYEKKHFVNK